MSDLGIAYIGPTSLTEKNLPSIMASLDSPPDKVACDTETVSIKDRTCIGIGMALGPKEAIYFRNLPDVSPYIDHLSHALCSSKVLKIYHNALFDLGVLTILGSIIGWSPIDMTNIADTSVIARVQGLEAALGTLAFSVLGMDIPTYEATVPPRSNSLDVHWSAMAEKCLQDCLATYRLYEHIY